MIDLRHLNPGIIAGIVSLQARYFIQPSMAALDRARDRTDVIAIRDDAGTIHTGRILVLDGSCACGAVMLVTMDEGAGISTFSVARFS